MSELASGARGQLAIQKKLARLAGGAPPRVLDLFAGCGGISLGFKAAGCRIDAAVEADEKAAATYALNFHTNGDVARAVVHSKARDITRIEPADLVKELGLDSVADAFDIIVGGPPCQAYTRVGRAKLREILEHPRAFKIDPRANLYLRYLHYVRAMQPLAILVENVPDILNFDGRNIMAEIAEALEAIGYTSRYTFINSVFHGVPQMRDRVFLIGYHRTLGAAVQFPKATHYMALPTGYGSTRSVALKHVDVFEDGLFVQADQGSPALPSAVTCGEAMGDLPRITSHLSGKLSRGVRRFDKLIKYPATTRKPSAYAALMRNWPGFENNVGIRDHVIRNLPRDIETFRKMPNGGEYPAAHATALSIWQRRIAAEEFLNGCRLSARDRDELKKGIVPPYPLNSFPNRWWKLKKDYPSRTLMAHIGKDTYSHIHYDSRQARVISVREAARLQSFPDGFRFCGAMNAAFRQIGNAVPPLIAWRLAEVMMSAIWTAACRPKAAAKRTVRPKHADLFAAK
ncbi:MAG: DNA cytosine methyltransferase [Beijerinckiaceae bacterium]